MTKERPMIGIHKSPAMDVGALLKLADLLDRVEPASFNMEQWESGDGCGFAGCAVGWFCRAFADDDLFLKASLFCPRPALRSEPDTGVDRALTKRFGISLMAVDFLFGAYSRIWRVNIGNLALSSVLKLPNFRRRYEHPHTTARRIRRFVYLRLHWAEYDTSPGVVHLASIREREVVS